MFPLRPGRGDTLASKCTIVQREVGSEGALVRPSAARYYNYRGPEGNELLDPSSVSAESEPLGTVEDALKHAVRLLDDEPALAEEQATEILNVVPQHPQARLLLARARARLG